MCKRILSLFLAALLLGMTSCSTVDPKETKDSGSSASQTNPGETDPGDAEETRPNSGLPMTGPVLQCLDWQTEKVGSVNLAFIEKKYQRSSNARLGKRIIVYK